MAGCVCDAAHTTRAQKTALLYNKVSKFIVCIKRNVNQYRTRFRPICLKPSQLLQKKRLR